MGLLDSPGGLIFGFMWEAFKISFSERFKEECMRETKPITEESVFTEMFSRSDSYMEDGEAEILALTHIPKVDGIDWRWKKSYSIMDPRILLLDVHQLRN